MPHIRRQLRRLAVRAALIRAASVRRSRVGELPGVAYASLTFHSRSPRRGFRAEHRAPDRARLPVAGDRGLLVPCVRFALPSRGDSASVSRSPIWCVAPAPSSRRRALGGRPGPAAFRTRPRSLASSKDSTRRSTFRRRD